MNFKYAFEHELGEQRRKVGRKKIVISSPSTVNGLGIGGRQGCTIEKPCYIVIKWGRATIVVPLSSHCVSSFETGKEDPRAFCEVAFAIIVAKAEYGVPLYSGKSLSGMENMGRRKRRRSEYRHRKNREQKGTSMCIISTLRVLYGL